MSNLWLSPHAYDASRLRDLFLCRRRFQLSTVAPIEPIGAEAYAIDREFGKAWHEVTRAYDEARVSGHEPLAAGLRRALAHSAKWPSDTGSKSKTRQTLVRAIIWYHEQYGANNALFPLIHNGNPAFELSFRFPLWPNSETLLCGNIDGVVEFGGEVWILERKSTASALSSFYWAKFDPNLQIDIYCLAAHLMWPEWKVKGVLVEAMQTGVTFSRCERKMFTRSPARLEETLVAVQNAVKDYQHATDPQAPNFASCMSDGGCPFRAVCTTDPTMRDWEISTHWRPRSQPWNPLNPGASDASTDAQD